MHCAPPSSAGCPMTGGTCSNHLQSPTCRGPLYHSPSHYFRHQKSSPSPVNEFKSTAYSTGLAAVLASLEVTQLLRRKGQMFPMPFLCPVCSHHPKQLPYTNSTCHEPHSLWRAEHTLPEVMGGCCLPCQLPLLITPPKQHTRGRRNRRTGDRRNGARGAQVAPRLSYPTWSLSECF